MELAIILENIEYLLRLKKMSADEASKSAGKPDAIRNIKRKLQGKIKGNGVTVKTLEALAKTLGTTYAELGAPRTRITVRPVVGLRDEILRKIEWLDRERAQAQEELEAIDQHEKAAKKAVRR